MNLVIYMRFALTAVLFLAGALRLWRLDQNGFGYEYYAAGVRSMSTSWHNFLYHAFDPAGFLSVDKPPVAMWIQVAAVKLFGFHGLSILLPQVLEGLASVWLVYHLVQRRFGAPAGLLAALFLAVTPVSVTVDRSNNTESCLVLFLLLAAWALTRAAEEGNRRFLLLAMTLIGLAFNVKMLAAFVVLPTFALVYFMGAAADPRRRLADATLAGLILVVVSLLWVAVYDFTPPNKRPYAGTTNTNSVLELVVGPYGIGRFVQPTRLSTMDTAQFGLGPTKTTGVVSDSGRRAEPRRRREMPRMLVRARAGPLRLLDGQLAGQVGWLFPLALAGVVLTALHEPRLKPFNPVHLAVMLWSGWALTYAAVYSAAGGIFHFHYMAMLAPPLAALAGIGTVSLWRLSVAGAWRAVLLPATLLLTAAWQLYVEASALAGYDGWQTRLHCVLLGGALLGAGGLVVFAISRARSWLARVSAACALGIGLAALLVVPIAWALSSVLRVPHNVLPSADLARLLTEDGSVDAESRGTEVYANLSQLIAFLTANRQGERYLLATSSTMLAAPIIIQTGQAVMARGGFNGVDPILTPEKLADMVRAKQVRFVMLGDLWTASRRLGAETAQQPIAEWVRANGKLVDPTLWRADTSLGSAMQLYDLRPGTTPLIAAHSDG